MAVAAPLALPEREPRNILLMIAIPALLVGIIGTLVVMYASGVRSLQSGFFPMIGLVGFGAMMFSGRLGRGRRIGWGELERQRRGYLRQLDDDRDEIQRAADQQRRGQQFVHADPRTLDAVIGSPRMWERRPADPDFLDVRIGIGIQQAADSAVSLQWPEVPVGEELEPVTGGALRDFILEQSRIRDIGKVLSLRSRPGFSVIGDDAAQRRAVARAALCSVAAYHSPAEVKILLVTRHPEHWAWLLWLPHNQHDTRFDACGPRRLVFASPGELEEELDAELHHKSRGPWSPPSTASPVSMPSPMTRGTDRPGPHWLIVDDAVTAPDAWEGVTGRMGMSGITVLRLAARPGVGVGFSCDDERFELHDGVLRHGGSFYAKPDELSESTAARYARALARWTPLGAGEQAETPGQGAELLRALGITDPRRLDIDRLWAQRRGRADPLWATVPVGVKPGGELQNISLRAKDFGGYGFHSVVIGTSGSGKSEYFLALCNGIALTHSPETFNIIFVDMKFESAAQDLAGLPHVAGSLSNLGKDDRHLAERMRKAVNGEIARRYRLFKRAGARDANEYEEMRLAGRELEPVPILLVIIDEYLELFHHHPDWIDLVIHIGQEGRGCNVFFTLGGQRLDLSSLSKAKSNIAFRVALRAETAEDSRDVIGSDAALHLPSRDNGYALLKVGPRELEQFRCFYVSAPFVVPKADCGPATVDLSLDRPRALTWQHQPLSEADAAALAAFDVEPEPDEFLYHDDGFKRMKLLEVIRDALVAHPARAPHRIWLPPLEVPETADRLVQAWRGKPWQQDYGDNPGLVFPAGIEDLAEDHTQRVHVVDAAMDNVMVVGTTQRGKSTALMTLMTTAALMYRPERITFYGIGSALFPAEELPHVAAVVSMTDAEGVARTLATLEALRDAREAAFKAFQIDIAEFRDRRFGRDADSRGTDPDDHFGDVFLVVDNFGDLYEKDMATGDRVIALARQGLSYGIHVMSSAGGWLVGQRQALINISNARIQLRLSNPDETQMGTGIDHRRAARRVPDRPGFGVTAGGHELLMGLPEILDAGGNRLSTRDTGRAIAELTGVARVDTLARLPRRIALSSVLTAFGATPGAADPLNLPFALGERALAPVVLPVAVLPNLLIVGRQGCGKTSALAAIGQAAMSRLTPDQLHITIIDPKTSLIGRVQGPHVTGYAYTADDIDEALAGLAAELTLRLPPSGLSQEELLNRKPWTGPHHLVLIDDEQELRAAGVVLGKAAASAPLWPLIERSREIGLHVVAARLPGNWAAAAVMNPLVARLTSSRAPTLFMDNDPTTVKVFGRISAQQLPPGRGQLVTVEGEIEGVLVGQPG